MRVDEHRLKECIIRPRADYNAIKIEDIECTAIKTDVLRNKIGLTNENRIFFERVLLLFDQSSISIDSGVGSGRHRLVITCFTTSTVGCQDTCVKPHFISLESGLSLMECNLLTYERSLIDTGRHSEIQHLSDGFEHTALA